MTFYIKKDKKDPTMLALYEENPWGTMLHAVINEVFLDDLPMSIKKGDRYDKGKKVKVKIKF